MSITETTPAAGSAAPTQPPTRRRTTTSDNGAPPDAPLPPWLGPAPYSDAASAPAPTPGPAGAQPGPGQFGPGQLGPGHGEPNQFSPYHGGPGQFGPSPVPPFVPGSPVGFGPGPAPTAPPALDDATLLRKARRAPAQGWRRTVHQVTGGRINPGQSSAEINHQQLVERVNRPVRGDYRIAVLSLKGGVGKTTTTVGLGSTFASLRGDRVIAVDANPDLGTLGQRLPRQTESTVRDLLADAAVHRYSDVRAHTSQSPSRLEVLASERDPAMAEAFNEDEYQGVMEILQRFYNIIITDCGTGLSHSAMRGVLSSANAIVLVSSPALDGARSASATLDWLEAHGYGHLVPRSVLVLSSSRPGASTIDTEQLAAHFLSRCRAVQSIPFDDHLAEGSDVDLDLVGKPARTALLELAAVIADDFGGTVLRREEPFLPG